MPLSSAAAAGPIGNSHELERVQLAGGEERLIAPGRLLVKLRGQTHVALIAVQTQQEGEAARALRSRPEVEFAELDVMHQRAFQPNDPLLAQQWHHPKIGSFAAWDVSLGREFVRIAIVDTPFQMDHPDLAGNVVPGWDAVYNQPVMSSAGIEHSTIAAGLCSAVIGNGLGVAGAGNCRVLPININGFTSEMCNAIYWCATNGVRVVNISWDGADSDAINSAAAYLRTSNGGVVAMPGLNGTGFVDYTNQPDIWCVAMTDAADNQRSAYGYHIDFAAPGWAVYSTTTNNGYAYGSGTSYATPLFCGVVATLFSINPTLSGTEVIGILKSTAVDLGAPGWDVFYGWGRIDFGAAAAAARATLPTLTAVSSASGTCTFTTTFRPDETYTLWRTPSLMPPDWRRVPQVGLSTNGSVLRITDLAASAGSQFYRLSVSKP